MVPSPPQANTVSLPAATAQRALSFASWLERQTVSSVRTPADWMMPMAWSSSASRFLPRRPELGLNRIVALRMRRASSDLSLTYACERWRLPFACARQRLQIRVRRITDRGRAGCQIRLWLPFSFGRIGWAETVYFFELLES